jgi:hypothetical protein
MYEQNIQEQISRAVKKRSEIINTDFVDRHRNYGALRMFDFDCVEFKNNEPALILELKHGRIQTIDLADNQFKCIRNTADKLDIPAFCVVYYFPGENEYNGTVNEFGDKRNFYIIPINNIARSWLFAAMPAPMTEKQFVELIYKIKQQPITPNLILDDEWNKELATQFPRILNKKIGTATWNEQIKQWEERIY